MRASRRGALGAEELDHGNLYCLIGGVLQPDLLENSEACSEVLPGTAHAASHAAHPILVGAYPAHHP
eukprot:8698722-Pyramimonas_sp.AAC.1